MRWYLFFSLVLFVGSLGSSSLWADPPEGATPLPRLPDDWVKLTFGGFSPAQESDESAEFAFSSEDDRYEEGYKVTWLEEKTYPGFISGLRRGFQEFPRPLDAPLYFEDPFINTDLRLLFLYHEFPTGSITGGGELTTFAVQARLALNERLQLIATADGYTELEANNLPETDGWNDLAIGAKYALWFDPDEMGIVSAGFRWRLSNGSRDVLQGIEDEISLFVTGAKAFEKLHLIGDLVTRLTTHNGRGNHILSWDLNASYEVLDGFFPMLEYHGLVYLSNGDDPLIPGANLRDGLVDYGNLGSGDVRGSSVHWATLGFRWNWKDGVSWGLGYSHTLQRESKSDIFDERLVTNIIFTF